MVDRPRAKWPLCRTADEQTQRAWREHLQEEGAASVGGGILTLRPSRASRPIRTFRDTPPWSPEGAAASLRGWIEAGTLRASVDEAAGLLDTLLVPAPGLESLRRREVGGDGWETRDRTLRLGRGVRFGASVDPVTEEIVGLLDGERTPREALAVLAERHGLEMERFLDGLPGALDRLLERGLLVPA